MHTGRDLWKLPHAGGVPNVRGHDAGREVVRNPEEAAVPVLPPAPRHAAMPIAFPTGMPYQRMHADAPQDAAQGPVARRGQTFCVGNGAGCRRHNPEENLLTSDSEDSALVTSDEEEGGEPEKSRLCMQMVPVEANNIVQGLHTLYNWGSTVTLVRRESMRRLGFLPAQVAQRIVNGFGGAAVPITGCHFLPLIDVRGNHQVICAFEVEEITNGRDEVAPLGQGGVSIRQSTHAMDGHTSRPDRIAHRPGQLAVAASAPGRLQEAGGEHEADEVVVWPPVHGDGWLGYGTVPPG
jgi:hypothetical protein